MKYIFSVAEFVQSTVKRGFVSLLCIISFLLCSFFPERFGHQFDVLSKKKKTYSIPTWLPILQRSFLLYGWLQTLQSRGAGKEKVATIDYKAHFGIKTRRMFYFWKCNRRRRQEDWHHSHRVLKLAWIWVCRKRKSQQSKPNAKENLKYF